MFIIFFSFPAHENCPGDRLDRILRSFSARSDRTLLLCDRGARQQARQLAARTVRQHVLGSVARWQHAAGRRRSAERAMVQVGEVCGAAHTSEYTMQWNVTVFCVLFWEVYS